MSKCIICLKGGIDLHHGPSKDSLVKLREFAYKRTSFGEIKYAPLCDRLRSMSENEYLSSQHCYHYACYKDVTHAGKLQRASKRYATTIEATDSLIPPKKGRPNVPPKRGRPSMATSISSEQTAQEICRPRRSHDADMSKQCVFQCSFPNKEQLHRVETESMGKKMMLFKSRSPDEKVRIALAHINQPLDCSAYDIMYHLECLVEQERKTEKTSSSYTASNVKNILADIDILHAVRSSLALGSIITMHDINQEYIDILNESDASTGTGGYKKHLKELISENIDGITFVRPHRLNESEQVITTQKLGAAVSDVRESQNLDEDSVKCLAKAARILRQDIANMDKWKFSGSMTDFDPPSKLMAFVKWTLIGTKSHVIKGQKSTESRKLVNIVSQQIINNFRTDRQVGYETKKDRGFTKRNSTPISVGLALTVHKKTRSKNMVTAISQLQLGASYKETVKIEKKISVAVHDRMQETGGYCLPPFVKKDKPLYFAADNVDFLENTPDGQNTLHGTILVVNQEDDTSKTPVNEPLIIPETFKPFQLNIKYEKVNVGESKPIKFEKFETGSYAEVTKRYKTYDLAWFMACHSQNRLEHRNIQGEQSAEMDAETNETEPVNGAEIVAEKSRELEVGVDAEMYSENSREIETRESGKTDTGDSRAFDIAESCDIADDKHNASEADYIKPIHYETCEQTEIESDRQAIGEGSGSNDVVAESQSIDNANELPKVPTKVDMMPTWAATNSLLLERNVHYPFQRKTNSGIIAPLFRKPPTDYATLYTVLCMAQGISAVVVGPNRRTVITLDLDLYERAIKLQSSTGNTNWVLRMGELHVCFASLHAIAKYIEGSGLDAISIEAGIYSPATVRQIFTGKWYKRGIEYHITHVLACYDLLFEAIVDVDKREHLLEKSCELVAKLHSKEIEASAVFEDICSFFDEEFHMNVNAQVGQMAKFLLNYMKQVECLMRFIRSSRQGEWLLHLASLEEQIKYYFAHDLYKYARLAPVYLAQMLELKTKDPDTWAALQNGNFAVKKSGIPFTDMFVDQTLEQKIRELKVAGGITGITRDEDALNRFFLIAPELTRIVSGFQEVYGIDRESATSEKQHYQLSGSMAIRIHENATKLKTYITDHCGGNPFAEETELMNIVSSMLVPEEAKEDILLRDEKGCAIFEKFVTERLVSESAEKSVWDPVKKTKLKTFATCQKKAKCKVGDKVVKLREDRQLLARFLVVQQSRPTMLSSLGDSIAKYEFSVIPRSLFSSDGLLLLPTDKSSFIHVIENYSPESIEPVGEEESTTPTTEKVCIIDAMAIVQGIKKGPNMTTCSDFADVFVQRITKQLEPYTEGRIIFDRYIDGSLKARTRGKRAGGIEPVKFIISDSTNIKLVPLKTLLSHTDTKSQLTEYLGRSLLRAFNNSEKNLVVVYGTSTYSNKPNIFSPDIALHSHEEADTLIPLHVVDATRYSGTNREVDVVSPDTDVLLLLMDLYARTDLPCELRFITGKGKEKRLINVRERTSAIGTVKSRGLLGLHNFTGADWGGKFVGISKKRWLMSYLSQDTSSQVVAAFGSLGDDKLDVSSTLGVLEGFVCTVYSKTTKCQKVEDLRWELFRSKNLEGEKLPPTLGALTPHLKRANYITQVGRGYLHPRPTTPSILDNGWEQSVDGVVVPTKCLELPAPEAVLELIKCGCRTQCSRNCSCIRNTLPCTTLCKCSDCENTVDYIISDEDTRDD